MSQIINALQYATAAVSVTAGWWGACFMEDAQWAWPTIAGGGILLVEAAIFRLKD